MKVHGEGEILVPAHLNFGKFILDRVIRVKPDEKCLINSTTGTILTYGEFTQQAVSLATSLAALGVGRGDTVALASEPRTAFLPTSIAVVLTGAAFTPIELECGRAILRHKFCLTKPKYVICSRLFWESYSDILKGFNFIETFIGFEDIKDVELSVETLMRREVDVKTFEPADVDGATDVAMVAYSSGSTGMSKGVMLTHLNCITRSTPKKWGSMESLKSGYVIGDQCSAYFIFFMYSFLSHGKTLVCECSNKLMDLQILQDYQVDTILTVPKGVDEFLYAERADEYNLSSVKFMYSGGGHLDPSLTRTVKQRYPHIKLLQVYGLTETGMLTVQVPTDTDTTTVGVAAPGAVIKVVDTVSREILGPNQRGEICARSPCMMKSYLGADSDCLDDDGFFRTGDFGYYDIHKCFYLVDRLKDIIEYLGFKVSPSEVEAVLLQHPAVREAAVVGKPAGASGELPVGFVVLQPDAQATEAEIVDYVAREVSSYMRLVGGVRFLSELPRSPRRKLLRQQLRQLLELE